MAISLGNPASEAGAAPTASLAESLTVRECVARARQRAPDPRVAAAERDAAVLDSTATFRSRRAALSFQGGATVAPEHFYDPALTNLGEYALQLRVESLVLDGGARDRGRRRSALAARESRAVLEQAERDAGIRAGALAIEWLRLNESERAERQSVEWLEHLAREMNAGVRSGMRGRADALRATLERDAVAAELDLTHRDMASVRRELGAELGRGDDFVPAVRDEAIEASVYLSNRYISDRFLPDKAIDLIDEAGARVKLQATAIPEEMINIQRRIRVIDGRIESAISAQEFEKAARYRLEEDLEQENLQVIKERWKLKTTIPLKVTREDIEEVIARWTGIPISSLHEEEMSKLLRMEEELHKRLISQEKAISALSKAIRRSRAGLKSPRRPVGSFLFLGPTGVGKTEMAKSLAAGKRSIGCSDARRQPCNNSRRWNDHAQRKRWRHLANKRSGEWDKRTFWHFLHQPEYGNRGGSHVRRERIPRHDSSHD